MRIGDPWEERAGPDQLLAQDSWARSPGATNIQGCPPKDIYDRGVPPQFFEMDFSFTHLNAFCARRSPLHALVFELARCHASSN